MAVSRYGLLAIWLKTLRISDEAHAKLTSVLGGLAEIGKMKTCSDAEEELLSKSVLLSL